MPPSPLRFPHDILRFLYWVFFKPFTLRRYLKNIDPTLPDDPTLFRLWRRRKEHPELRSILQLALFHLLVTPWLVFPLTYLFQLAGFELSWVSVAFRVAFGVAFGMVADVAFGVALGVAFGVAFGMVADVAGGVAGGVAEGVAFGVAFSMVADVAFGVALGVALGVTGGVAEGVAFLAGYFRLFLYLFEAPYAWLHARLGQGGLSASPVMWDELIWLPLPGLDTLLVKISLQNRQEGLAAIQRVAASFRQGWAARNALLELIARDMESASSLQAIGALDETLAWVPDNTRDEYKSFWVGLKRLSGHARAAIASDTLYNRQQQLEAGQNLLQSMIQGLTLGPTWGFTRRILPALQSLETIFARELAAAREKEKIQNVYVAATALRKGSPSFKGRKDIFMALESELVNPAGQRPTILLFGARRMGKTSTLRQLPLQLGPNIIPVDFDLQKATTVESAAALLYLLARDIVKSAYEERRVTLPGLSKEELTSDPYLAFQEWVEKVEDALGSEHWILLALDEFESLGHMKEAERIDERIFQLLRGLIQGHPRFTVVLSGAHTLAELPPYWSNYFINTKTFKVGPLAEADARELIVKPIPDFRATYDEEAVAYLLRETGCHPNWLQGACGEVVDTLNRENRFTATLADVQRAVDRVPEKLHGDFKDLWEGSDSNEVQRAVLKHIARSENGLTLADLEKHFKQDFPLCQQALDFLLRRDVILNREGRYTFRANLLRRWVAGQI